jgi:hypothetical protein
MLSASIGLLTECNERFEALECGPVLRSGGIAVG